MSKVRDIVLNRVLFHVEENESVAEVARQMADVRVGAILVLHDGQLRGVFSERDLMLRVVLQRLSPEDTPVSAVMTTQVATIDESDSLEQAMEAMHRNSCRHLPVLRDGQVAGFLSMRDLMDHELARQTEELRHMHAYIQGAGA
jgi:signal-transduction protein with cAMP-binding, CBS, and nucleotidyltransferase domain